MNKVEIHLTGHGEGTVKVNGHDVMVTSIKLESDAKSVNILTLTIPTDDVQVIADECNIILKSTQLYDGMGFCYSCGADQGNWPPQPHKPGCTLV